MAESLAPAEPGRPPRPWLLPFISAAGPLLKASNRPVLHAAERIRGVRHQRTCVLERDGGDRRVLRADHLALALPFLPQTTGDGGGFAIEGHREMAAGMRF